MFLGWARSLTLILSLDCPLTDSGTVKPAQNNKSIVQWNNFSARLANGAYDPPLAPSAGASCRCVPPSERLHKAYHAKCSLSCASVGPSVSPRSTWTSSGPSSVSFSYTTTNTRPSTRTQFNASRVGSSPSLGVSPPVRVFLMLCGTGMLDCCAGDGKPGERSKWKRCDERTVIKV